MRQGIGNEGLMTNTETAAGSAAITARLERLPSSPYLWRLVLLLSAGAFFEIYDLLMTAYVSPGIIHAGIFSEANGIVFGLSDQAAFASATFAGLFIGTLLFGSVADRFGRRVVFTYALLWYAAATAVMACQSTATGILIARFVAGIGIGVEMITIDTFLAELMPKRFRGRAFAAEHGLQFFAVPTVAFLSWALIDVSPLGIAGWRWVAAFAVMGALVIWWIRRELPESPRWLAQHGRFDEADAILKRIEVRIAIETGKPLDAPIPQTTDENAPAGHGNFAEIFRPPFRKRAIMLAVFNFFQTIGFYGFSNWVPKLVSGQGFDIRSSLLYSFIIAFAYPAAPLLFMLFADRIERKWQIVIAACGTAFFGLLFTQQGSATGIVILGILITFSAQLMSYGYHAYQAELFPTRIRSRAVGFTYSFSRLSTIFTSFMVAFFAREAGNVGVFAFIAVSMFIAAGAIGFFGPSTHNRTLEEINRRS
jgi:putative MFS transporter